MQNYASDFSMLNELSCYTGSKRLAICNDVLRVNSLMLDQVIEGSYGVITNSIKGRNSLTLTVASVVIDQH